jgi:hypothetical protein
MSLLFACKILLGAFRLHSSSVHVAFCAVGKIPNVVAEWLALHICEVPGSYLSRETNYLD